MRRKEMKARIAKLERENRDLMDKIDVQLKAECDRIARIRELRSEVQAEKEKYAALLERHISMMEKMAGFKVEGGE